LVAPLEAVQAGSPAIAADVAVSLEPHPTTDVQTTSPNTPKIERDMRASFS
jgi:hypothetical protein